MALWKAAAKEENMRADLEKWRDKIKDTVQSGSIEKASRATLTEYSTWLVRQGMSDAFNDAAVYEQHSELVRLHLQRALLDEMERRSAQTQCWVIVLAIVAIVVGLVQIWFAYKADLRAELEIHAVQNVRPSIQSEHHKNLGKLR